MTLRMNEALEFLAKLDILSVEVTLNKDGTATVRPSGEDQGEPITRSTQEEAVEALLEIRASTVELTEDI